MHVVKVALLENTAQPLLQFWHRPAYHVMLENFRHIQRNHPLILVLAALLASTRLQGRHSVLVAMQGPTHHLTRQLVRNAPGEHSRTRRGVHAMNARWENLEERGHNT